MRTSALVVIGTLASVTAHAASGGTPLTMAHSGYVLDAQDQPQELASVAMTFRIFDRSGTEAGETLDWEATCAVAIRGGFYAVVLGAAPCAGSETLDTADVPHSSARWLEVTVGGVTLSPRVALHAAPLASTAVHAFDADTLGGLPPTAFAPVVHTHVAADVTDFAPAAVTAVQLSGVLADADHSHPAASSTTSGFLTAADYQAFSAKVAVEQDPKIGAVAAGKWCTSNGSQVICTTDPPIGTSGLSAGTYQSPVVTVDAQGRITSIANGVPSPISFVVPAVSTAAANTLITSAIVLVTGFNTPIPVSVSGQGSPAYRVCTDATCSASPAFTTTAGTITNNAYLQLRLTSATAETTATSANVTTGGYTTTWTVTTADVSPNPFSFTNVTGATTSSVVTSNAVTLGGFTGTLTAMASGGATVSTDGSTFASSVSVTPGANLQIRLTASASASTAVTATVTVGTTTSSTWSVTTAAAPTFANSYLFVVGSRDTAIAGSTLNLFRQTTSGALTQIHNTGSLTSAFRVNANPSGTLVSFDDNSTGPWVAAVSGSTLGAPFRPTSTANSGNGSGGNSSTCWTATHFAYAGTTAPFLQWWSYSGSTFTKLTSPADPTGTSVFGRACGFTADGSFLALGHSGGSFLTLYSRSSNTLTRLAAPTATGSDVYDVAWSGDTHMIGAPGSGRYLWVRQSATTVTANGQIKTLQTPNSHRWTSVSPDGNYMVYSDYVGPQTVLYVNSINRATNTFTQTHAYTMTGAGNVGGGDWSPDGKFFLVGVAETTDGLRLFQVTNGVLSPVSQFTGGSANTVAYVKME